MAPQIDCVLVLRVLLVIKTAVIAATSTMASARQTMIIGILGTGFETVGRFGTQYPPDAGRSNNDLVKIAFVLGMMLIFVPIDIILEIGGDIGVLVHTALVIGLLIWLRERIKQAEKFLSMTHSVG